MKALGHSGFIRILSSFPILLIVGILEILLHASSEVGIGVVITILPDTAVMGQILLHDS